MAKSVDPIQYTFDVITHPYLRDLAWSQSTLGERDPAQVTFTLFNRFRREQTKLTGAVLSITYTGSFALVSLLDDAREIWKVNFQYCGFYKGIGTAFSPVAMNQVNQP